MNKSKIFTGLVLLAYTSVVIFLTSTINSRFVQEEVKAYYQEEYCEVVYEYTGDVGGEDWEDLIALAIEMQEERDLLQEELDAGIDAYLKKTGGTEADAYISLFYNLADPINWLFTFLIASFVAGFYLAFYASKLWIQRHFKGNIDE